MKVFAKPTSSPRRPTPDDLPIIPPPLITFPRTRSKRGSRSRANPMFVAKINTANDASLEPSSPKVTCIGQVKIRRRSRSNDNNKQTTTTAFRRRCRRWLRKLKPRRFRRVWRRTLSFLRCGYGGKSRKLQESERRRSLSLLRCDYGGKSKKLHESERIEANNNQKKNEHLRREIEDVIIPDVDSNVLISGSPPRNAFLLTRSRSAPPCGSSSFPSKNWEKSGAEGDGDGIGKKLAGNNTGIEEGTEAVDGEFAIETGECEGFINGECEGFKGKKPLSLSRCKSVPGRTGDKHFSSFGS